MFDRANRAPKLKVILAGSRAEPGSGRALTMYFELQVGQFYSSFIFTVQLRLSPVLGRMPITSTCELLSKHTPYENAQLSLHKATPQDA